MVVGTIAAMSICRPPGDQDGDAVPEELGSQGGHDGRDPQQGDQQAVDVANERAGGEGEDEADQGGPEVLEPPREDEPRQGNDSREAQVDLARRDDEGEPDAQHEQRGHRLEEGHVDPVSSEHRRRGEDENDVQDREDDPDGQALDLPEEREAGLRSVHGCTLSFRPCEYSKRNSSSSFRVIFALSMLATISPRSMTMKRSEIS